MSHIYTTVERISQLKELITALSELISALEKFGIYPDERKQYHIAQEYAGLLLAEGFCQEDLGTLNRQVPTLFWLHKEWTPDLERDPSNGNYREPGWFTFLEPIERRVVSAKDTLRQVGYY